MSNVWRRATWAVAVAVALAGCLGNDEDDFAAEDGPRPACSRRLGTPNHVPEYLRRRGKGRPLAAETPLRLRVALRLRDEAALESMATRYAAVQLPSGPLLTPQQYAQQHQPSPADTEAAVAALRHHGLTIDAPLQGHLLHVSGTADQIGRAFATQLVGGADPGTYRPHGRVTPPAHQIVAVTGIARHQQAQRQAADPVAGQGLSPAQIRTAYAVPAHLTGKGQRIAVVALDGYDPADIAAYCRKHNLREVPRRAIYLDGYDGKVLTEAGRAEVTLDLELVNAIAPDADEMVVVFARPDDNNGLLDALSRLANPQGDEQQAAHISCSWGRPETGMSQAAVAAQEVVLRQLALTGSTVWAASGDNGAQDDGRTLSTDSPASSGWSMATGGTTLVLDAYGQWLRETTWGGSGGGLSCFLPTPLWQAAVVSHRETQWMRAVPDVALNADPATGYEVIVAGKTQVVGGTSCAAPIFAGLAALLDEARAQAGLGPLGFAAPHLYRAAATPATKRIFHDIITGDNSGPTSRPGARQPGSMGFSAVEGFDKATGFGSPDFSWWINVLAPTR